MSELQLIECPRDAMQGIKTFIPTQTKANYINQLLKVGFHTLDCTSFVSPQAIPQMRDAHALMSLLELENTATQLLAIVANERGAQEAVQYDAISYIGYPFSLSETFQVRNTSKTIVQSYDLVKRLQEIALSVNKTLVIYFSMAFGNPYQDLWDVDLVYTWADKMHQLGVTIISLSDTVGLAKTQDITVLFKTLIPAYKDITFGVHLHTLPYYFEENLAAAHKNGCRRFDAVIQGFGGCPLAKDELIGNIPTERVIAYLDAQKEPILVDRPAFAQAQNMASDIFRVYT